jgi:predicted flap endonuclease-1-like 5' DNA nuclease
MAGLRATSSGHSVGWALIAIGALAVVRAWVTAAPPVSPSRVGTRVELSIEALAGDEFRLLPGVGPVLAGRLVAARQAAGGRLREQDLDTIAGIGPSLKERWREAGLLRERLPLRYIPAR